MATAPTHVCRNCGRLTSGKGSTGGSFAVELVLWLFFCLPGLIYSLWRMTSQKKGCSFCGSSELVPSNSPMGQKIIADLHGGGATTLSSASQTVSPMTFAGEESQGMSAGVKALLVLGCILALLIIVPFACVEIERRIQPSPASVAKPVSEAGVRMSTPAAQAVSADIKPALHVRSLLAAKPAEIKTALARELGKGAKISYDKVRTSWNGELEGVSVEIITFKNRVVAVSVSFTPSVSNSSMALAEIDLKPFDAAPTEIKPAVATWRHRFDGISEVYTVLDLDKHDGHSVSIITVTPDTHLAEEYDSASQRN